MATSANPHAVFGLLDRMDQPVLVFNLAGAVTFANTAARNAVGSPMQALAQHEAVRAVMRDVTLGKAKLPQDARLEAPSGTGTTRFQGTFLTGPSGMDLALVLNGAGGAASPGKDSASGAQPLHQIVELLRSELVPPARDVLTAIGSLPPSVATSEVTRSTLELTERLDRLVDLVKVFGEDALIDDNRVVIPDLVRKVCRELAPIAERQKIQFVLVGESADLPPIYGSENLLHRALRECLGNAIRHARSDINAREALTVEVRFTPSGNHLLVGVHNRGATPAQRRAAAQTQPFAASNPADGNTSLRIGLPLAKRIVELHGGHIRVGDSDSDEIQVLLELPTGAPQRNPMRLDMVQAQKYAADLAKLVSRQRKERA